MLGESPVRAGSHGKNRRDPMADALVVAQTPLVERGQLGNPESLSSRASSRGRGGGSPRSRVGAVAGANVANQPHEEGRPARDSHKCLVANDRQLDRGRRRGVVELLVIIWIIVGARRPAGLAVLLICLCNRRGGRRYDRICDRRRGRGRRAMSCSCEGSSL